MSTRIDQIINLLLSPKRFWSGLVNAGASRINAIASVGYNPTYAQRSLVSPLFNYLQGQGLSGNLVFHHDPRIGFNNNLCRWTDDITTANIGWQRGANLTANGQVGTSPITGAKVWSFSFVGGGNAFIQGNSATGRFAVLPNTTYTISADVRLTAGTWTGGNRSLYLRCQDSGGVFTVSRGGSALALTADWQRFSITVTTGASDAFASFLFPFDNNAGVAIEVAAPQVELGSVATAYQRRLDNTALRLNNTVNNALGDGTLLNGEVGNMTRTDAQAGEVLNFNTALSQAIVTAVQTNQTNYSLNIAIKPDVNTLYCIWNKGSGSDRGFITGTGQFDFRSDTGTVTTASGFITAGAWNFLTYTVQGNTIALYKNGVLVASSGSVTRTPNTSNYEISRSSLGMTGQIGEATLINTVLTPTQIQAIYNIQKARYGL